MATPSSSTPRRRTRNGCASPPRAARSEPSRCGATGPRSPWRRASEMPIAVTEEHEDLRRAAQRWLETHCPPAVPRAVAEAPSAPDSPPSDEVPALWEKMAAQGWLGLHVPERDGGQGFTLAEVAVVLEELGHALFPGPLLPTLLVSAALVRRTTTAAGSTDAAEATGAATRLLSGLAD